MPTSNPPLNPERLPSESLDLFLREVGQTDLLSAEEEVELALRIAAGDQSARQHMARANLRLVVKIARGFTGRGMSFDDLVQEGGIGLLRAVDGFDPAFRGRFSTYASYWVKQSMRRALHDLARPIRIPVHVMETLACWWKTADRLHDKLGRPATADEVATEMGLSEKKFAILKRGLEVCRMDCESLDSCGPGGMMADDRLGPHGAMEAAEEAKLLQSRLDGLAPRHARVLRLRFGFEDGQRWTLDDVGALLGIGKERVRQIESESLAILRAEYGDGEGDGGHPPLGGTTLVAGHQSMPRKPLPRKFARPLVIPGQLVASSRVVLARMVGELGHLSASEVARRFAGETGTVISAGLVRRERARIAAEGLGVVDADGGPGGAGGVGDQHVRGRDWE